MTPEQFVYWLQGYVEIARPTGLVWEEIANHLQLVLSKKTPTPGAEKIPSPRVPFALPDSLLRRGAVTC